jgi:SOS response regulatory protein OraA/RecX
VDGELVEQALDLAEPEHVRARRIVERRGRGARTARYLVSRGFAEEVVELAVAGETDHEIG